MESHGNFNDLFDFDQATSENDHGNVTPFGEQLDDLGMTFGLCPLHPLSDCLCPNVIGGWTDLQGSPGLEPNLFPPTSGPGTLASAAGIDTLSSITTQDYSNFPQWIPGFQRPPKPCDYCRARRLDCFITASEQDSSKSGLPCCNPCRALFRQCSLTTGTSTSAAGGYLDTLHSVSEDVVQDQGTLTGTKPLITLGATYHDVLEDRLERKSGKPLTRFSRATVGILRNWLDAHADHPYPTDEEKDELKQQTGLKRSQISNWLANARRRGKVGRPKRCASPSLNSSTKPIDILTEDNRTPMERWKDSPPEHEPATIGDIKNALSGYTPGTPTTGTSRSLSNSLRERQPTSSGSNSAYRAASTTSRESVRSSNSVSQDSSWSHGSRSSYNSLAQHGRRRRRRMPSAAVSASRQSSTASSQPSRPFQCTFCTDSFQSKYDWTRHEKSLHLSLEKWVCAPFGPVIATTNSYNTQCVYCQELNPSQLHIDNHNHRGCEEKGLVARTFYRKDHLRQHLRLVHSVAMHNSMEDWKSAPTFIRSRCGFCGQNGEPDQWFTSWQDRNDHLAKHFRSGANMSQWRGAWGFDAEVARMVTNAMPPFLIGKESQTMEPFSASNEASMRTHVASGSSDDKSGVVSSDWEVLTLRLGQFVRHQQELGVHITDQMLQKTAREIIYGSDDEWNQTEADNEEWLDLFKEAYGVVNETTRQRSLISSPTSPAMPLQIPQQQMMMHGSGSAVVSPYTHPQQGFHPGSIHGSPQSQQHQGQRMFFPQLSPAHSTPISQADMFEQEFGSEMPVTDVDMLGEGMNAFNFEMN